MRRATATLLWSAMALVCVHMNGTASAVPQQSAPAIPLANDAGAFKFAVLGNSGSGEKPQYELADQMAALRDRFDFRTVLLLGGNIHGGQRPQDFTKKFEEPYRRLLGQSVEFRAALGKDDSRDQRFYRSFNMKGQHYYTFSPAAGIQFFALDSTNMTPAQVQWLENELKQSSSMWRIAFLHHPLYSSGDRGESQVALRNALEPLFVNHRVSLVFSAGDNFYERITPQKEISHFIVGSGGMVRRGGVDRRSGLTATAFDTDLAFLAGEIAGDAMTFNAISRTGQTVDSGRVSRRN